MSVGSYDVSSAASKLVDAIRDHGKSIEKAARLLAEAKLDAARIEKGVKL